jgi:hypothetical protein
MLKYGSVAMLVLAGWAALNPATMSWAYLAAVAAFEAWLLLRMRAEERGPVAVGEPPYRFTAEEAELVGRYRFYFAYPALCARAGSVLAAIGLSAMVLALWLTFRQAFLQGAIAGLDLFAVGWFTRRVAPVYALRMAAARGKRDALRMLEILDPLWMKIRAANQSAAP